MKKRNVKSLKLNKKSIANFQEKINGGAIITITTCTLSDLTNVVMCYTLRDEPMCWEAR